MQMPSYVSVRSRSGSRDGVALILVLACIVLLSILILSMISFTRLGRLSTASYSRSIQAQEIAQGGIQDILGDLHTEIVAGSVTPAATYISGSGSYARAYIPTNNFAAAPAHIGYDPTAWAEDINGVSGAYVDGLAPTLLRVSRASQDPTDTTGIHFYPNIATNSYFDPTLIKNLINRASASNTSTPSANGRSVSYARWNKTFLIGCSSTTNEADSPYCMPGAFCFTNYPVAYAAQGMVNTAIKAPYGPPDWVYVTRAGSRVCTNTAAELALLKPNSSVTTSYTVTPGQNPPASPIIGRYAYVVYDEGATLDVNAAGYYSSPQAYSMTNSANFYAVTNAPYSNFNMTNSVTGKSYLPYADLSISSLLQSQANVNTFITWRNGSISSITGAKYQQAAFNYSLPNTLGSFLGYNAGDNPLLSRQDLINYFASVDSTFNTDNSGAPGISRALPYLGTFSRAVSAPSWYPELDNTNFPGYAGGSMVSGTGTYTYRQSMETTGIPNRDMANVRLPSTGGPYSITHYFDDATTGTYTSYAGDPLLKSRFSLSRLAWLSQTWAGQSDPGSTAPGYVSSVYPAAIQACFGLVWDYPGGPPAGGVVTTTANGGNKCWNYVGSTLSSPGNFTATSSTPASSIETLDQVAAESVPRDPNFFELLKAAILSGSLGKDPGHSAYANGVTSGGQYNDGANGFSLATSTQFGGPTGMYSHSLDGHSSSAQTVPSPAAIPDAQIIQIGANIISQFSADSYPTAIYFRYLANPANSPAAGAGVAMAFDPVVGPISNPNADYPLYGPVCMFYGDENLPALTRMLQMWCTTAGNGTDGGPTSTGDTSYDSASNMSGFFEPELWNMHQQPAVALANAPSSFQIRAYGAAQSYWDQYGGRDAAWTNHYNATLSTNYADTSPLAQYFQGTNCAEVCPAGTVNFTAPSANFPFYASPYYLTVDQTPGVTASSPDTTNTPPTSSGQAGYPPGAYCYPYYSKNHFVAFSTGNSTDFYVDPAGDGAIDIHAASPYINTFCLGWLDSGSHFHPYSYIPGAFTYTYNVLNNGLSSLVGSCLPDDSTPYNWSLTDPRTTRFSIWSTIFGAVRNNQNLYPSSSAHSSVGNFMPVSTPNTTPADPGFVPGFINAGTSSVWAGYPEDWQVNATHVPTASGATTNSYADPDGVIRPGDGYCGLASSGDGILTYTANGSDGTAIGDNGGNVQHGRRPVILNRPFRNVGELGYTFRDEPFKTLDFFSQSSADAALLDVFSTIDESQVVTVTGTATLNSVVAGKVDINNAPVPVLNALLNYGSKKDLDASYDMLKSGANSDSSTVATAIANQLAIPAWNSGTGTGPMASRADLVTLLGVNPTTGSGAIHNNLQKAYDKENKAYLEAPVRALSNVANARTWNLMIDLIAQSGELTPTATSLDNFVVQGEKRYWLHIAIDRYTGKIVDQQLEQVYE